MANATLNTYPVNSSGVATTTALVTASADAALSAERVLTGETNVLTVTDNTTTLDLAIATNGIGVTKMAQLAARSVLGRSANSTGNMAAIAGAGANTVLTDDGTTVSFAAAPATRDVSYYRQIGTSVERWYSAQEFNATAIGTVATAATLTAVPFVVTRGGTIDRFAINITSAAGSAANVRAGLYTSTSATNLYPDALLVDSGAIDVFTGGNVVVTATVNQALTANTLYWIAFQGQNGQACTISAHASGALRPVLGNTSALSTVFGVGWTVARAIAALPSTFPGSATVIGSTTAVPAVWVRYSA